MNRVFYLIESAKLSLDEFIPQHIPHDLDPADLKIHQRFVSLWSFLLDEQGDYMSTLVQQPDLASRPALCDFLTQAAQRKRELAQTMTQWLHMLDLQPATLPIDLSRWKADSQHLATARPYVFLGFSTLRDCVCPNVLAGRPPRFARFPQARFKQYANVQNHYLSVLRQSQPADVHIQELMLGVQRGSHLLNRLIRWTLLGKPRQMSVSLLLSTQTPATSQNALTVLQQKETTLSQK